MMTAKVRNGSDDERPSQRRDPTCRLEALRTLVTCEHRHALFLVDNANPRIEHTHTHGMVPTSRIAALSENTHIHIASGRLDNRTLPIRRAICQMDTSK